MTAPELALFRACLARTTNYLEFGTGGSTCVASATVAGRIVSVDSSMEWLRKVADWCAAHGRVTPRIVCVDIGPVGAWGRPTDEGSRARWPAYHASVWETEDGRDFDTFMVDGRFRVACFLQSLRRCRADATLLFHDFASRPAYHVVRRFADEVAAAEELSAFRPKPDLDGDALAAALEAYAYRYG